MKVRSLSFILVIALFVSSCNLPSDTPGSDPTPTLGAEPVLPEDTPIPSETPLPTDTPPPTLTSTPTVPIAWPKGAGVNCRLGPGIAWIEEGALLVDQKATIVGINADRTWYYIKEVNNPGLQCWVAASVTETAGNLENLPIVPNPTASVIKVTIEKPDDVNIGGCVGPVQAIKLKGTVEVNGPMDVEANFSSEQDGALPSFTINFDSFGSKSVSDDGYTPTLIMGTFTYWVRLVVTSPNNKQAEKTFEVTC
ncbi:MAG: hypothetical protein QGD88_09955 [Anaerolineae bacterium]|nr:hypothetical protein [Anaerolineae bacterium]MDK1081787.1 hypothetical protein [Anaerolineae bacterium]